MVIFSVFFSIDRSVAIVIQCYYSTLDYHIHNLDKNVTKENVWCEAWRKQKEIELVNIIILIYKYFTIVGKTQALSCCFQRNKIKVIWL